MSNEDFFLGRKNQVKSITNFLNSNKNNAALVYGRRRVGKTELLKHCLNQNLSTSIYYECKETSELNNVESFSEIISETFGLPPLAFNSFEATLAFLYKQATEKEIIVVIDEYPYIRNVVKGLDSIIQTIVDKYKDTSKLMLILCGSFMSYMEEHVLAYEAPLYGRRKTQMKLLPFDFGETCIL